MTLTVQPTTYRIAVFASGNGSNFQAIVDAFENGDLPVKVELLVCDRPSAHVIERAKTAGVPTLVVRPKEYESKQAYERYILQQMQEHEIHLIVLAGYMRIITDVLVSPYYGRMINIHPSLLPAFPGLDAIRQAIDYGVKQTGVTVHFVDGGMDTGPIIAQRTVEVHDEDTVDTLAERIHRVEHTLLPEVIRWLSEDKVSLNGRKVTVQ